MDLAIAAGSHQSSASHAMSGADSGGTAPSFGGLHLLHDAAAEMEPDVMQADEIHLPMVRSHSAPSEHSAAGAQRIIAPLHAGPSLAAARPEISLFEQGVGNIAGLRSNGTHAQTIHAVFDLLNKIKTRAIDVAPNHLGDFLKHIGGMIDHPETGTNERLALASEPLELAAEGRLPLPENHIRVLANVVQHTGVNNSAFTEARRQGIRTRLTSVSQSALARVRERRQAHEIRLQNVMLARLREALHTFPGPDATRALINTSAALLRDSSGDSQLRSGVFVALAHLINVQFEHASPGTVDFIVREAPRALAHPDIPPVLRAFGTGLALEILSRSLRAFTDAETAPLVRAARTSLQSPYTAPNAKFAVIKVMLSDPMHFSRQQQDQFLPPALDLLRGGRLEERRHAALSLLIGRTVWNTPAASNELHTLAGVELINGLSALPLIHRSANAREFVRMLARWPRNTISSNQLAQLVEHSLDGGYAAPGDAAELGQQLHVLAQRTNGG